MKTDETAQEARSPSTVTQPKIPFLHVNDSIQSNTDSAAIHESIEQSQTSLEPEQNYIIVGGVALNNLKLVMSISKNPFADLPISIQPVAIPASNEGLLLAPVSSSDPLRSFAQDIGSSSSNASLSCAVAIIWLKPKLRASHALGIRG